MKKFLIHNLKFIILVSAFYILHFTLLIPSVSAITNPLSVPNNRYGIHIISATEGEASAAAGLVNANGDWGYITVLAESGDRNEGKWQEFFNELRRRHLIPLVRLATKPDGNSGNWERPYEGEETAWADFLDKLNWPTQNRYVILYNEPNHGSEWGGTVDPEGFAIQTNKTIDALRAKNDEFFILNAGFDASSPDKAPSYMDQEKFMIKMNETVPGIFNQFDGWVSHSYPNPAFKGKPTDNGRGTIRTWEWEQQLLNRLGVNKVLPVFITETGWKHSNGIKYDESYPGPEVVAEYYKQAFATAWASNRIVAVTPFLLDYKEPPFDQFSFKINQGAQTITDAGKDYHLPYYVLQDSPKEKGKPLQIESAEITKIGIEKDGFTNYFEASESGTLVSLAYDEPYKLVISIKNTGQTIWGKDCDCALILFGGGASLDKTRFEVPADEAIEPNQETTFNIPILPLKAGDYEMSFNFFSGTKPMMDLDYPFSIEVKAPVFVKISASLKWKDSFAGRYILGILGELRYALSTSSLKTILSKEGRSDSIETKYLLPDQQYTFTLEKPYYKPKSINKTITAGENDLDFGELQPDIRSAILRPVELWKLLPWSN